ncbi:uncharacterized protein FIBRA_06594 [Fibroporia radiculosa]|uniref:Uncharacterized protein n=1 Tax=Fibroporia radiculosa TaxID=599839 RepID=J4HZD1_9APHY|nr:uncharacterized protein FIBRA_06594 [Fibroporia radiculosa]CCM04417.1 predicted protein [Fibroporia radiculosa]
MSMLLSARILPAQASSSSTLRQTPNDDRSTRLYTSMILNYASRLESNHRWFQHERHLNELRMAPTRRAFTLAVRRLRDAGIQRHPRDLEGIPVPDSPTRSLVREAKLAWKKFQDDERTSENWERVLIGSSEKTHKELRADLRAVVAASLLHRKMLVKSRLTKSRWGVLSKTVLVSVRLRQKTKAHI